MDTVFYALIHPTPAKEYRMRYPTAITRFRIGTLVVAVIVSLATVGCLEPKVNRCSWGLICPPRMVCDEANHRCVLPEQIRSCDGVPENHACDYPGMPDGVCVNGVCQAAPHCGDGVVQQGELCDDGDTQDGDGCSADCRSDESCGNSILDPAMQEECDDGNVVGGDGCSGACRLEYCGNGVVDPGEVCDDGNTESGDGCHGDCRSSETCGNGIIEAGEACDGADPGPNTCQGLGYVGGEEKCTPWCTLNLEGCIQCGDGVRNPKEECDGTDLGGQTCLTLSGGSMTGTLACTASCRIDNSGCVAPASCGNRTVNAGEQCDCDSDTAQEEESCDATKLNHVTCNTLYPALYGGGQLRCSTTCLFDTSSCLPIEHCGNGLAEIWLGEQCDGTDLGEASCQSLGYLDGDLDCAAGCTFDTHGCQSPTDCGDGVKDPTEQCDGADVGGATCASLGFSGGTTLACNPDCTFDIRDCVTVTVESDPPTGVWTPTFTPYTYCACSPGDTTCHTLYVARVLQLTGNTVTLEFSKVSLDPPSTTVHYWVAASTTDFPDCNQLDALPVRSDGFWGPPDAVLEVTTTVWEDQQAFENAPCSSTQRLILITGGGGGYENVKVWFQKQAIEFTKYCD